MARSVLYIVPEYIEVEHITYEVKPSAVKKHRGKKGINAIKKTGILRIKKISRHKAISIYENLKLGAKRKFVKKHQDIYYDEDNVNDWKSARRVSIADRDHWSTQYT